MARFETAQLAGVRDEIRKLADVGHNPSGIRTELKRLGRPDDLIETGMQMVGYELRRYVADNLRRGWTYAIAEFLAAIVVSALLSGTVMASVGALAFFVAVQGLYIVARAVLRSSQLSGWPDGPDPLPALGVKADDLSTDRELLERDAAVHKRSKRAERMAIILAIIVGVPVMIVMYGTRLSYLSGILTMTAVWVVLRQVFFRAEGLPAPKWFPTLKGAAGQPSVVHVVPRVEGSTAIPLADVPRAPRLRSFRTHSGTVPGEKKKKSQKMVPGVLYATTLGISFLPDLESELLETWSIVGEPASKIVGDALKLEELQSLLALGGEAMGGRFTHEVWLNKAIDNKWHFAIPWPELVRVEYNPQSRFILLTRQAPDGTMGHRVFQQLNNMDNTLAGQLMSARLRYERNSIVYARLVAPMLAGIRTEVRAELGKVYGDRIGEHEAEIAAEADHRLGKWFASNQVDTAALVRDALPGYAQRFYAAIPEAARDHADLMQGAAKAAPAAVA